jgi:hypothetical protein
MLQMAGFKAFYWCYQARASLLVVGIRTWRMQARIEKTRSHQAINAPSFLFWNELDQITLNFIPLIPLNHNRSNQLTSPLFLEINFRSFQLFRSVIPAQAAIEIIVFKGHPLAPFVNRDV